MTSIFNGKQMSILKRWALMHFGLGRISAMTDEEIINLVREYYIVAWEDGDKNKIILVSNHSNFVRLEK